jgi:hypothetical protein
LSFDPSPGEAIFYKGVFLIQSDEALQMSIVLQFLMKQELFQVANEKVIFLFL